jgi:replicative DNA helicase
MNAPASLDLRPANQEERHPPANIEAEQAILGSVLYDNDAFHRVDGLKGDHFYEPFHGRLWQVVSERMGRGVAVDPVLLDERFKDDGAYRELGGIRYLADLVDRAPPSSSAPAYADEIIDIALRREVMRIGADAIEAADKDQEQSGREIAEGVELQLFALGETSVRQGFRAFGDYLTEAVQTAAEAFQRDGNLSGISTGLIDLDRKLGGMHPSDLLILAARPSMGKTALACNVAFDAAKHYAFEVQPDGEKKTVAGGVVAFFSLEMSGEQLAMRILAEASGVSGDKIRKGEIDANEFGRIRDAAELINTLPLHIDDTAGLSIGKLAARARRLKRTVGLDLIVVDYLQLLRGNRIYKGGERVQEVSEITVGLKGLAKDLGVPVLALSQLSRQVENRENKRPQLSDLRESGSIEQDADMVMFLYREEYYVGRNEPAADTPEHQRWQDEMYACRGKAEAIIAKQRHGPIGTVHLAFNADTTKFGNLARNELHGTTQLPYGDDD